MHLPTTTLLLTTLTLTTALNWPTASKSYAHINTVTRPAQTSGGMTRAPVPQVGLPPALASKPEATASFVSSLAAVASASAKKEQEAVGSVKPVAATVGKVGRRAAVAASQTTSLAAPAGTVVKSNPPLRAGKFPPPYVAPDAELKRRNPMAEAQADEGSLNMEMLQELDEREVRQLLTDTKDPEEEAASIRQKSKGKVKIPSGSGGSRKAKAKARRGMFGREI